MVTMNFMGWDHTAAEIKRLKAGKDVIDFRAHFILFTPAWLKIIKHSEDNISEELLINALSALIEISFYQSFCGDPSGKNPMPKLK